MSDGFFIGPVKIYYYSLCILVAVWMGLWLATRRATHTNIATQSLLDIMATLLVAGVVGGRLGFVVQNVSYFAQQPLEILRLTSGGLSIHGALVAGILTLIIIAKKQKRSLLSLTDLFSLPLLLGQIIGRLGNYFNQELFGYPTALPWGIFIDPGHRPAGFFTNTHFHPVFLYEMILHAVGFLILWRLPNKKPGYLTLGYALVFSITRYITEIFRISDRIIAGLSLAQIISLIVFIAAILLAFRHDIFQKKQYPLANLRKNRD